MTTSRVPIRRSGLGSTGVVALSLVFSLFSHPALAQNKEKLPDGVEHYYFPATANGDSYLSKLFSQIYDVVFTTKSLRPFGRSIAFLAGVPQYHNLSPQLPSVHNDLAQMRDFLLNDAHFDEV